MATFSSASKSNRLLQSLRYTVAGSDSQEAYTNVLDLNASEIYIQQNAITSSGIPYSGSSQDGQFLNSGSSNVQISRYFFRHQLSPSAVRVDSNSRFNTFFFMSGSGFTTGSEVDPQLIGGGGAASNQLANFISNKYADANLAANNAEASSDTAYNVVVSKGSTPAGATVVSAGDYQFDYKTGVLQFKVNSTSPTTAADNKIFMTAYQYVGQTLDSFVGALSGSGGGSGAGFPFSGSAVITGSLLVSGSGLVVTGSSNFSGSTSVTNLSGVSATFQSGSFDHLTVNVLISGSTIVTSGSNTFGDNSAEDIQTLIGTTKITGSAQVTGSLDVNGVFSLPGIANVSASIAAATGSNALSGIFTELAGASGVFNTTSSLQISGSTLQKSPYTATGANITQSNAGTGGGSDLYAMVVSESVWHRNANVGVPTSNAWGSTGLGGSYFENFDQNTNISEILRFVAGLLSSSAPNSSPNTKTFGSINSSANNGGSGTIPDGKVPQSATNNAIAYIESKGFAADGGTLFSGVGTVFNNQAYFQDYTSVAAGSTTVSSSVDTQLFGLGGVNTLVQISGGINLAFESSSTEGIYLQSSSGDIVSRTGAGSNDGLTLGSIQTANPAVIPVAFQDGKFADVFNAPIKWVSNTSFFANPTASMGFYHLSSSISISTASGNFLNQKDDFDKIFFASSSINTTAIIPLNTVTVSSFDSASLSSDGVPTSRSLSGAPYLLTANYRVFNSASGLFSPLYSERNGSNKLAQLTTNESDEGVGSPADATGHSVDLSMNSNGTISTSENVVFDSTGATPRAQSSIPFETDSVKLSGSIAFSAASGKTNVDGSGGLSPLTFRTTATYYKRDDSTSTSTTDFNFHDSGSYGQPAASGSMAYYGRAQGYDTSTETGLTERFVGEDTRKKINDNLLTIASATAFDGVASYQLSTLTSKDLQITPKNSSTSNGLLITPGGSRKYWFNTLSSDGYGYYARIFDTDVGSQQSTLKVDLGITDSLVTHWSDTSTNNRISCVVLMESLTAASIASRGLGYSNIRLFDIKNIVGGSSATYSSGTTGTNPFSSTDYDVFLNNDGSSTVENGIGTDTRFVIPLISAKGMLINASYQKIMVLVRYKGDPAPMTQMTISVS